MEGQQLEGWVCGYATKALCLGDRLVSVFVDDVPGGNERLVRPHQDAQLPTLFDNAVLQDGVRHLHWVQDV